MKKKLFFVISTTILVASMFLTTSNASAATPQSNLTEDDFLRLSTGGFDDSANSYAWGIEYFNGALYVGTNRHHLWSVIEGLNYGFQMQGLPISVDSSELADSPINPVGSEAWANEMRAEIWRYQNGQWTLVHQAGILNLGVQGYYPESYGYRMLGIFNGKLYVCGIGTWWPPMPINRIIMSDTGDLGSWQDVSGDIAGTNNIRGLVEYKGKLYVSASTPGSSVAGAGLGAVWCSANPEVDPWVKVSKDGFVGPESNNTEIPYLAVFNGYLYASTLNYEQGFEVWKTDASDPDKDGIYEWTQVLKDGFGDTWNQAAITMEEFDNHLYIGTAVGIGLVIKNNTIAGTRPSDLIRLDKDDNAELVMGSYVAYDPVEGYPTLRVPISKWPAGFGNPLNVYIWHMEVHKGVLYVGTFDMCGFLKYAPELIDDLLTSELIEQYKQEIITPEVQAILDQHPEYKEKVNSLIEKLETADLQTLITYIDENFAGADLWKTSDGKTWKPVTLNGFDNPNNYGIRTLMSVSNCYLIVGTANPFTGQPNGGCEVLVGSEGKTVFSDGFESKNFRKWSGTCTSNGEKALVTSAVSKCGSYSAKFTSNGNSEFEKTYSYKNIQKTAILDASAYFKVTTSGICQVNDSFTLLRLEAGGFPVAYAGWTRTNDGLRCFLTVYNGDHFETVYSNQQATKSVWYNVNIRWVDSSNQGSAELWINNQKVCSMYGLDTASNGAVNLVKCGLPLLNSCHATTVYVDSFNIKTFY
ncbi:MAG: hypothetical protein ACFCUE_05865 [Candidatus Bathyarchaeia archaeon]|jgi:hypothetical protein